MCIKVIYEVKTSLSVGVVGLVKTVNWLDLPVSAVMIIAVNLMNV